MGNLRKSPPLELFPGWWTSSKTNRSPAIFVTSVAAVTRCHPIRDMLVFPSAVEGSAFARVAGAVTTARSPEFRASSITSHIHFSSHAHFTRYFLGKEFDALIHRRAESTKTGFLDKPLRVCVRWKFAGTQLVPGRSGSKWWRAVRLKRRTLSRESIKRYEGRPFSFVLQGGCSVKLCAGTRVSAQWHVPRRGRYSNANAFSPELTITTYCFPFLPT